MNPNLGENFIVYSRRVSTPKCAADRGDWQKDGTVNRGPGAGVGGQRKAGRKKDAVAVTAHDENRWILLPA